MNACVGPRCERCDGREDVTVNRERTRQAFPQSFQRLDFKKMFRELQYMALGTYSLDPVHSPVSSCSCVKPQMFLLYANMYIRLRTSSLFFLRRREREVRVGAAWRPKSAKADNIYVLCRRDIFHPQNRLKVHSAPVGFRWKAPFRYNAPNLGFRVSTLHTNKPFSRERSLVAPTSFPFLSAAAAFF